ncbi:MAG: NADH-quinone oxidoreductase subunit A, partial [Candidatus Hodarchaeales archaeon]
VKIQYTKTWELPSRNWMKTAGWAVVALIVLFVLVFLSFLFSEGAGDLRISNSLSQNYSVYDSYVALIIWAVVGSAMFIGALTFNYILAPWSRWRKVYVPDESYSETTYECGENPIGEGRAQTNLQYYSFAIVFVIFDVITSFTLMFALVYGGVNNQIATLLGYLFFALFPLAVLGFWVHKKAILWQ